MGELETAGAVLDDDIAQGVDALTVASVGPDPEGSWISACEIFRRNPQDFSDGVRSADEKRDSWRAQCECGVSGPRCGEALQLALDVARSVDSRKVLIDANSLVVPVETAQLVDKHVASAACFPVRDTGNLQPVVGVQEQNVRRRRHLS